MTSFVISGSSDAVQVHILLKDYHMWLWLGFIVILEGYGYRTSRDP